MKELKMNWTDLIQILRMSIDYRKILTTFVGLLIAVLGFWIFALIGWVASGNALSDFVQRCFNLVLCHVSAVLPFLREFYVYGCNAAMPAGCYGTGIIPCNASPFFNFLKEIGIWGYIFTGIGIVWFWIVSVVVGGTVTRIAAVEVAKDDRIDVKEALKYAFKHFWTYFLTPVGFLVIIAIFCLAIYVGGLIGRIPGLGQIVVALSILLAFVVGFIIVFLSFVYILGSSLFTPTISAEGSDFTETVGKIFTLVSQKPWHLIIYNVLGAIYWVICTAFVWMVAWLSMAVTLKIGAWGMSVEKFRLLMDKSLPLYGLNPGYTGNWVMKLAGVLMGIQLFIVAGCILAYPIVFCACANTLIYFLMRNKAEGIEPAKVYEEEEEEITSAPAEEKKEGGDQPSETK